MLQQKQIIKQDNKPCKHAERYGTIEKLYECKAEKPCQFSFNFGDGNFCSMNLKEVIKEK